jgi:hypothetical protein
MRQGWNKVDGQSNHVGATVPSRPRVAVYQISNLQIIDSGEATQGLPYIILPHFVTAVTMRFGSSFSPVSSLCYSAE